MHFGLRNHTGAIVVLSALLFSATAHANFTTAFVIAQQSFAPLALDPIHCYPGLRGSAPNAQDGIVPDCHKLTYVMEKVGAKRMAAISVREGAFYTGVPGTLIIDLYNDTPVQTKVSAISANDQSKISSVSEMGTMGFWANFTPTTAGSADFTVMFEDGEGLQAQRRFLLPVLPIPSPRVSLHVNGRPFDADKGIPIPKVSRLKLFLEHDPIFQQRFLRITDDHNLNSGLFDSVEFFVGDSLGPMRLIGKSTSHEFVLPPATRQMRLGTIIYIKPILGGIYKGENIPVIPVRIK